MRDFIVCIGLVILALMFLGCLGRIFFAIKMKDYEFGSPFLIGGFSGALILNVLGLLG